MTKQTHKRWLKFTAFVIGSFGPVFSPQFDDSDHAARPLDARSAELADRRKNDLLHPDTRFLSALTGGFLTGWGITVFCLSCWVYDLALPRGTNGGACRALRVVSVG